ncbi:MAG: hypothetical protein JXA10_08790 [Anaerolineae bacterium]|nr:hypothetical protein [Anaerolineae bacterium]
MTPDNLDLIAGWVSLVLTLFIFSYLLGDNVLYRIAVHVLVGVAAGYAVVVAVESVIVPWLNQTLGETLDVFIFGGDAEGRSTLTLTWLGILGIFPFLIGALMLLKYSPQYARVGNLGMAFIIGVGTAVAIVGAVAGTIIPLTREAGESIEDSALNGLIIMVGTITTLIYFQYYAVERGGDIVRPRIIRTASAVGRVFITLTLGALYAGAILTSLAIFSDVIRDQLQFILDRVGG